MSARARPKAYYFLTPVWGESYTQLFLDTAIPAQLAPANLPAFADISASRYIIFTTEKDAHTIRNAPVFAQLQSVITVQIELIGPSSQQSHDLMSSCHKLGITIAEAADAAVLFLNPDLVFADGSFRTVRELAEAGTDVVLVPGIRTLKQDVVRSLQPHYHADHTLVVPPRALMRIALDHLHPLADGSWWEEKIDADLIPANLYWRAGEEGIVARCFHLHPLMVYPQRKGVQFFGTVDDDYIAAACPDASHDRVITNSDQLLTIELSNPGRAFHTGLHKGSIDDCVIWAEQFASRRHRSFFAAIVTMHTGISDTTAWSIATQKAATVADAITTRLALPTKQLLKTQPFTTIRRLIRWANDQELLRVNGLQGSTPLPHALLARMLGSYFRIARRLSGMHHRARQLIFGTPWAPHVWTWNYPYTTWLRREMEQVLATTSTTNLVIVDDPARSVAAYLLRGRCELGMCIGDTIMDHSGTAQFTPSHYTTIIVEQTLPAAAQLQRLMAPGAKLIVLMEAPTETIQGLLTPTFQIILQTRIGNHMLAAVQRGISRLRAKRMARRVPFFFRALFASVLVPCSIVFGLLVNITTQLAQLIYPSRAGYSASITIAITAPE